MFFFTRKKVSTIILIIALIVVLHYTKILTPIENGLQTITKPIFGFFYEQGSPRASWKLVFKDKQELQYRIQKLQEKNAELEGQIITLKSNSKENKQLKNIAKYHQGSPHTLTTAKIIGRPQTITKGSVLIDRGASSGIQVTDLVIDEYGNLIGDIIATTPSTAHVRLSTDPNFKIAVQKPESMEVIGIARGNFSVAMTIELIPNDTEINEGDLVVSANINNTPENIPIGTLNTISSITGNLFKTATLKPLFNLDEMIFVSVVNNKE